MTRLMLQRPATALAVCTLVVSLSWAMVWMLPGDVAMRVAAGRHGHDLVTVAAAEAVRQELGLALPVWQAWLQWCLTLLQQGLGHSWVSGRSVWAELQHQLGATLSLTGTALLAALAIGLPLGWQAGRHPGSLTDRLGMAACVLLRALPPFLLAVVLMLWVAVHWGVLPVAGMAGDMSGVLPALTLALGLAASLAQVTRQAVLAAVSLPSHQFARTCGLSEAQVAWQHDARHAAAPVLSHLGVQTVWLLEGAVVVESLFAWPGIGHALVHAVFARDVPMIQGCALCMALLFVGVRTAVDLLCQQLDARGHPASLHGRAST